MSVFTDTSLDISTIDENEIKLKNLIKKGIDYCDLAIVGIPFDGATFGRQGAKYAPKYVREALHNLNTYSYHDKFSLDDIKINDFGDVLVSNSDLELSYSNIMKASKEAYNKAKIVAFLGGDHSITYSTISSLSELGSVSLIIFDAHHDIRKVKDRFSTSGKYLRDLIEKKVNLKNVIQIGIRDFYNSIKYIDYLKKFNIKFYTIEDIREKGIQNICYHLIDASKEADYTYLSIDLDVIDAIYIKGLNSLCVNGLAPHELMKMIREIAKIENLKAFDIVELAPLYEEEKVSCMIAAYLVALIASSHFSKWKRKE
ncbi:MAG: agmatinase family protein [Thermoproteota archaeon]|jgi:formimidoylglutamase|nr:agmatinase family protein [Thermoproteota archaeon]